MLGRIHLLLAFVAAMLAFTYWGQRGHPRVEVQFPILCGLFCSLILLSRVDCLPARLAGWDRRLGELSYPLYISHGIALTLTASLLRTRGLLPYAATVALALALAVALHVIVEQPMRGWRDRLRGAPLG